MIRSVTIRGFENHDNTLVEFGPGFNLLWGDSNAGKRSILRSIQLASFNEWEPDSLQLGSNEAYVKVESDKGYVEVTKKKKSNKWTVCKEGEWTRNFENIGRNPEEVLPYISEVTGFRRVNFGSTEMTLNVMNQADKHFILSEIDGKKSSGSTVAQIFDEISGLVGVEELIKSMAVDQRRATRDVTSLKIEIEELEDQLHPQDELDVESIVLDQAEEDVKKYDLLGSEIGVCTRIVTDVSKCRSEIADSEDKLKKFPDVTKVETLLVEFEQITFTLGVALSISSSALSSQQKLDESKKQLATLPKLKIAVDMLTNLSEENDRISLLQSFFGRESSEESHIKTCLVQLVDIKNELGDVTEELNEVLAHVTVCPLTGNEISDECKIVRIPVMEEKDESLYRT